MELYSSGIYSLIKRTSRSSSEAIVPIVHSLVCGESVIDFGCGTGDWLCRFKEYGALRILGLDGNWVDRTLLSIDINEFAIANLNEPYRSKEKFDIAVCLEVMGHIPKECEDTLIDSLTDAAPVILFSAPIPHQTGIGKTVNCEWPSYWANKFMRRGYLFIDCIRHKVWNDPRVASWFSQNIFLVIKETELEKHPKLQELYDKEASNPLHLVHPDLFEGLLAANAPERLPVKALMLALLRAIKRRLLRVIQ
jgi:hypothetical protein